MKYSPLPLILCFIIYMMFGTCTKVLEVPYLRSYNTYYLILLGVWGGKGQGKTFQTELIFRAMDIEPVIMSAGELESERAGKWGPISLFAMDLNFS